MKTKQIERPVQDRMMRRSEMLRRETVNERRATKRELRTATTREVPGQDWTPEHTRD